MYCDKKIQKNYFIHMLLCMGNILLIYQISKLKHIGMIIIADLQMPTKTQNMGNLFPIKETSWVITISFTANVKVRIWGYNGRSIMNNLLKQKRRRILHFSFMKNLSIPNLSQGYQIFVVLGLFWLIIPSFMNTIRQITLDLSIYLFSQL